jgi:DtxR family Mn-dependent transcriptional regulator
MPMDTWKEFEANELTHSAAHHLLAIHDVGAPYGGWARVSDIARKLNITRGSVSINLRTLKKRGWIETDAHRLVKLSPAGLRAVQAVMAKRVVFKTFLVEVLGVSESQSEIDACKIEHLLSDETGERLVHLVRLLTLDPDAGSLLKRFRRSHHHGCPKNRSCDVCKGHCLVVELGRAV